MELHTQLSAFREWDVVQRALQNPSSPTAVLSFMFGVDVEDEAALALEMRTGQAVLEMRRSTACASPLRTSSILPLGCSCRPA